MQQLCYEVDVEPYARSRDTTINQMAAAAGVQVSAHVSHTLYVSSWTGSKHTLLSTGLQEVEPQWAAHSLQPESPDALPQNLLQIHAYNMITSTFPYLAPTHPSSLHHLTLSAPQDTDLMVKKSGGKPPLTMQSFTKLVDKVGDPPPPLPTPVLIPAPGPVVGVWGSPLEVPSLQEVGLTGTPTTIFKVSLVSTGQVSRSAHCSALVMS